MKNTKISIIGCGNIGLSLLQGIIKSGSVKKSDLIVTRRNTDELDHWKNTGIRITSDNAEAVRAGNLIIIAVKPYNFKNVLSGIRNHLQPRKHILISLTAGITMAQIRKIVPVSIPVFRVMPNISASVAGSISCICHDHAGKKEIEKVNSLFSLLGTSMFIGEELMDSATILGACGIAYTLRFIRAMTQAGIQIGFDSKTANAIVNQTVRGAAELLIENKQHPEFEIDKVTTPRGCTIVGLNEMEHNGFSSSLIKGIVASFEKCISS
jgi:pyrroline-5-carboxylate reductase